MANHKLNAISLCSGVGMLDEGVRAGLEFLGIELRTIAYAEWEAPAATQLITLMEARCLDEAPVWCGDIRKIDARKFRGVVDCVIAGFPCQDISIAGRRAGLDGKRSGLFFDILDIADDCGATGLFLENVSAIATATATAVDEAEGALDERAAARVVGELADRGWDAEWITIPASDVGASHGRARWFCFAWRLADPGLQHQHLQQRADGAEPATASIGLSDAPCDGWNQGRAESGGKQGRPDAAERGGAVANAGQPRLPNTQQREPGGARRWVEGGAAAELRAAPLFAPGPSDPAWAGIIDAAPWLAPALADPSGAPGKKRLNPLFGEWLMGWPIGWTGDLNGTQTTTCGADFQGGNSQASATGGITVWRDLLQMRLAELLGEAPRGLQQTSGRGGLVQPLPRPGAQGTGAGGLCDLQDAISTSARPALDIVREPVLSERTRGTECRKAMESRSHRLRQVGNGVVPLQAAVALVELVRRAARH